MGRKIRRVIGAVLLLCAVLITKLPVPEISAAGSDDFQMNRDVLVEYIGTASSVSISDTVKEIGEEAFANNLNLNTISCGNNVKKIAHGAFANCTYLNKAVISDSVEEIDSAAFSGCRNLSKVRIGKNVKVIGDGVFAGCNALKSITIDKDNKCLIMEDGALYNKDKTVLYAYLNGNTKESYNMQKSVKSIKEYTFWGNERLEKISLSNYLEAIPGYAFANCRNLEELVIPYSVNSIDAKSFENCVSLQDITIPASVTYIDPTAFDGCYQLNIIADEGSYAYEFFAAMDKSDVAKTEESDTRKVVVSSKSGDETDKQKEETKNLKDASKDPSNVEYMPQKDPLSGLEDSSVIAKTIVVGGSAVLFLNNDNPNIHEGVLERTNETIDDADDVQTENSMVIYDQQKGGYLPKYTIVDNKIAGQAFYASMDMKDYVIPDGITTIGDFSFARSNVASVEIPNGVKSIGYGAFYHCDNLTNVQIPQTVEDIKANAFVRTPYLTDWMSNQDGNDYLIVGNHILLAYKGNSANVEIPEGVIKIAPNCFQNHGEIESVYLPESMKVIGEDAFRECYNLTMISGGNNLEEIEDRAFYQCPLKTFTVPENVKKIGLRAIDFTNTYKEDNTKTVIFDGDSLPEISYGDTSKRLMNEDYRKNALHNVLFAIVNDSCENFDNSVLDGEKLGFSGLILSIEKDASGNETGNVIVRKNNIFSNTVLEQIPREISVRGKQYQIKDFDKIKLAPEKESNSDDGIKVIYNKKETDDIKAHFSEDEVVGYLSILEMQGTDGKIKNAYEELFGENTPEMMTYDIKLMDITDTVPITKFGKSILTITMPIPEKLKGDTYHVICLDEDNQLEEVNTYINKEDNTISFETSHLSEYAIYATGNENVTLNIKDGKLIKNFKKDDSPDTGDYSISIKYVAAIFVASVSLLLIFWKSKYKRV